MPHHQTPESPANVADAGLLQRREFIRRVLPSVPHAALRQVFDAIEDCRNARRVGAPRATRSHEMNVSELRREIAWRLDTLPAADADAIAALVRGLADRQQ